MNIYVSNLSFNVEDEDLRGFFEEYGEIKSAKVITDKFTQKSRGFGFVEMASSADAQEAISNLNNKEIEGRAMSVSVAKEKTDKPNNKRW